MPRSGNELIVQATSSLYSDPGISWKITRIVGCGSEVDYATNLVTNGCVVTLASPFDGDNNGYSDYNLVSLPVDDSAYYTLYVYIAGSSSCCGESWTVYTGTFSCNHACNPVLAWVPKDTLFYNFNADSGFAYSPPAGHFYLISDDYQVVGNGEQTVEGPVTVTNITYTPTPNSQVAANAGAAEGRYHLRYNRITGTDIQGGFQIVAIPTAPTLDNVTDSSIRVTIPNLPIGWAVPDLGVFSGIISADLYRDGVLHTASVTAGQVIDDTGLANATAYAYKVVYHTRFDVTNMGDVPSAISSATTGAGSESPSAPDSPLGSTLKHKILGFGGNPHVLSYDIGALPIGAESLKLRIRSTAGVILGDGATGEDGDTIVSPNLSSISHRGYVSLVAVNSSGETEGPPFGFDINPSLYTGYTFGNPLPEFDPGTMSADGETTTTFDLLYNPPDLPDPASAPSPQLWVSWDNANLPNWGSFARLPGYPFNGLEAPHIHFDIVAPSNPARLAWQLVNSAGAIWGTPASLSLASPPSAPPPPGVSIISGTAADVAALAFAGDWGSMALEYGRVGYPTAITPIVESSVKHLTGLVANAPYQARFVATNSVGSANGPWTPFTPSSGGGTGGGTGSVAPTAPGEITLTRLTDTTARVEMPTLPANADSLRLIYSGGTFIADLASGSIFTISGLTPQTDYSIRARAVNVFGMTDGPDLLFTTESTAEQGEGGSGGAPDVPAAPTLSKACAMGGINVYAPAWDTAPEVTGMELRRRMDSGSGFGAWSAAITVWNVADGSFFDSDVEPFFSYEYQVRALNAVGESAWSTAANVTLQSGLTITWLSPASGAILSVKQDLRFQLIDDSEPGECDEPVGCSAADPAIALFIDGMAADITIVRESGTARNGIYRIKGFDTRDFAQGTRLLTPEATGVDCCRARAPRSFIFSNTIRRGTLYFPVQWEFSPPAGQEYGKSQILMQNEALYAHPTRRYWVKMGLTTQPGDLVDWASLVLTPQQKASAFDALQAFTPETGQHGTTPERTQIRDSIPILKPGQQLFLVQQWNPLEVLTTYLTGVAVGAVRSIRRVSNGLYHIFASRDDGSAAKLFAFDYEAGLSLLVDLGDHDAADARDCVRINDKYFVVRPAEVFTIDADPNEIEMPSDPRGETRTGRFVLKVPANDAEDSGESDISIGIYVDEDAPEEQTAVYDLTYRSPKLLWILNEVVTLAQCANERLMLGCGLKLFSCSDITTPPTILHTFAAEIISIGLSDETWLIGLANNHVWAFVNGAWADRGALTTPPLALSGWEGAGETVYDVAGGNSAQLFERVLGSGLWSDLREIEAKEADVTQITALSRYEKITREESGTPGEPGYQPQESTIGLLIGTAPDGALLLLELSPISNASALLVSKMSHYSLEGLEQPTEIS